MKINLHLKNDETGEVIMLPWQAESCGVLGLCVHKAHTKEDGKYTSYERSPGRYWWNITHVSSGIAVIEMLLYKNDAWLLSEQLKELDWTVSADEIKSNPEYGKLVSRVKAAYYVES